MARVGIQYVVDTGDAIRKIKDFGNATKNLAGQAANTASQLGGLQGVIGRLALVETGRRVTMMAAGFKQTQLRLKLLSEEFGEYEKTQKLATKASKTFGLSQTEAASGIADIYARLRPIGVELEDIESTFVGFNTAAKLSGVSAAAASGAFLQLAQALGSGRLQGDEFRSIAEQLPKLNQIIAKEMGVPIGQLKKLASEGKVTAEVVINALKRIEKEGGGSIKALMEKDPTQQFKNLSNAVESLSIAVGNDLLPAAVAAVKVLTEAVKWIGDVPDPLRKTVVGVLALAAAFYTLAPLIKAIHVALMTKLVPALIKTQLAAGPVYAAIALVTAGVLALVDQNVKANRKQKEFNELLGSTDEKALKAAISLRQLAIAREEDAISRLRAENMRGGGINPDRGMGLSGNALASPHNLEPLELKVIKLKEEVRHLNEQLSSIPDEAAAEKLQKANAAMAALGKTTRQTGEEFKTAFAGKLQGYLKNINDFGGQMGSIITKSFEGMEDSLVQFVQNGKLSFKDFANSIINDLIRIAVRQAVIAPLAGGVGGFFSSLFSGGSTGGTGGTSPLKNASEVWGHLPEGSRGLAGGGPVSGGTSYLVGERGPEIFTPHSSGNITPNHAIGGGGTVINVSVDANETNVSAQGGEAKQLGSAIAVAVQQQLVKERRPGGLLYA